MQYTNPTDTDSKDWRRKYSEAVRSMEEDERRYREQSQTLKRLIGRLCAVGNGQSAELDAALARLKEVIAQEPAPAAELDAIGSALAGMVLEQERRTVIQHSPAPRDTNTSTEFDPRLRDVLSRLLAELRRDPELTVSVDALLSELAKSTSASEQPALVQQTGALATQRIQRLETLRGELETLLEQMVGRLDEMSAYIAGDEASRQQETTRRDAFSTQMASDVKALGDSVAASSDLSQIRSLLRTRLDSISKHIQDFRQRESAYNQSAHERTAEMRARISELETETGKLHQRILEEKRNSLLDPLTQIANRLGWDQRIAEELKRWQQFPQPTCIATWDIDHFKRINDNYGHTAGDKVLKIVASALSKRIRASDFVARYGGEEFVMVLPNTTLEHGVALVDKIREAVSKIGFHFSGQPLVITISCGIATVNAGDTATSAFERADQALYRSKETGRNRVTSG